MEAPDYNKTVIVENTIGELFKTELVELSQGSVQWAHRVGQVKKWAYYSEFNKILEDQEHHCDHTNDLVSL
jgi:hypothetical protein